MTSKNRQIIYLGIFASFLAMAIMSFNYNKETQLQLQSYTACGCGCCADSGPAEQCLHHSRGDSLEKIIEDDKKAGKNPQCATLGCTLGIKYIYCD